MPREWPPLSVWLLLALIAGPAIGLAVTGAEAHCLGVTAALFCLPPAPFLLAGHPYGYAAFALVVLAQVLLATMATLLAVVLPAGPPVGVCVAWWLGAASAGGLLLWPATRRWCGLLPEDEPDDGDE